MTVVNETVTYLSVEWLREAADAVRHSDALQALAAERDLGVTQAVNTTGDEMPDAETVYHLRLDGESARLALGPAEPEHVRFSMDLATAAALAAGDANAHELIIAGRLRVSGDPTALIDAADVFTALDAALAPVRARTSFPNRTSL